MTEQNDNTVGTIGNIQYNHQQAEEQCRCRICLEDCPEIYFCKCRGGLLCHRKCLEQFLKRQYERGKLMKCEICKEEYVTRTQSNCFFSCSSAVRRFKQNMYRSIIAILTMILLSLEVVLFIVSVSMQLLTDVGLKVVATISALCILCLIIVGCKMVRDYFVDFTEEITLEERQAPIKPISNTTLEEHILAINHTKSLRNIKRLQNQIVKVSCRKNDSTITNL